MSDDAALLTTPLHALHLSLNAKMVPFAGYDMPVQYPLGVKGEHLHTREHAGLFDVSHMGQVLVQGANATAELESLIPVDLQSLAIGQQSYGVFTNAQGGILDDLIIARWADDLFFVVVNAACKHQDIAHLQANLATSSVTYLAERALLALQGPEAAAVMARFSSDASAMTFMQSQRLTIDGIDCFISRSGYTGEDGFEISIPAEQATAFAEKLLAEPEVEAIGLGARDSLRLEAGLCLYGQDMDTTTNLAEANLLWSISASRRAKGSRPGGFMGAEALFAAQQAGVSKKRVGLEILAKTPVRGHPELVDASGQVIGVITSGGFSPSLNKPIAMGYVDSAHAAVGSEVYVLVRGKQIPLAVAKTPFVPQRYFRG
ncbi:glycine cleavage system aminomethyltransferase GcvT [Halioxenophilus sp. WMMB6]|uniref:glycine cleavage system aminomethyltransferase GcvT n=1 Tax=Halioxenophilus sp. WMMB6 TaxID=3073815 RepID=UPI00295E6056|nr:glycine cleavage system aminomethyltransferase GcvT [Halioxenophilus sp. WMMB6]